MPAGLRDKQKIGTPVRALQARIQRQTVGEVGPGEALHVLLGAGGRGRETEDEGR